MAATSPLYGRDLLQVVGANPVASTKDFKYLVDVLVGGREARERQGTLHVVSNKAVASR
jgi:hypothetical protein